MSAVCILAPVVVAAWPAFSAAVVAAASSLGYEIASAAAQPPRLAEKDKPGEVEVEIEQSQIVTDQLARDQHITVTREGVSITFSRDVRGKASLCVTGTGYTDEQLRALGEELGQRVVQQYVYQKLLDEFRARQFMVVEEEVDENHAIRLKVRHWEN